MQKHSVAKNSLASIEQCQPGSNRQERQEELTGNRHQERDEEQSSHGRLGQGTGDGDNAEGENADDQQEHVLKIIQSPLVLLQGSERIQRGEGCLQRGDGRCRGDAAP